MEDFIYLNPLSLMFNEWDETRSTTLSLITHNNIFLEKKYSRI